MADNIISEMNKMYLGGIKRMNVERFKLLLKELQKLSDEEKRKIVQNLSVNDRYMTLYEVAEYTSFGYDTVKEFARQKDFPYVSLGRKKVVKRSELDAWLKKKTVNKINYTN